MIKYLNDKMGSPKYIRNWEELAKAKSPTHILKIDLEYGCGWIIPKEDKKNTFKNCHYLSTHTFYGNQYKQSTQLLQSCGFNVELANLDEIN